MNKSGPYDPSKQSSTYVWLGRSITLRENRVSWGRYSVIYLDNFSRDFPDADARSAETSDIGLANLVAALQDGLSESAPSLLPGFFKEVEALCSYEVVQRRLANAVKSGAEISAVNWARATCAAALEDVLSSVYNASPAIHILGAGSETRYTRSLEGISFAKLSTAWGNVEAVYDAGLVLERVLDNRRSVLWQRA